MTSSPKSKSFLKNYLSKTELGSVNSSFLSSISLSWKSSKSHESDCEEYDNDLCKNSNIFENSFLGVPPKSVASESLLIPRKESSRLLAVWFSWILYITFIFLVSRSSFRGEIRFRRLLRTVETEILQTSNMVWRGHGSSADKCGESLYLFIPLGDLWRHEFENQL